MIEDSYGVKPPGQLDWLFWQFLSGFGPSVEKVKRLEQVPDFNNVTSALAWMSSTQILLGSQGTIFNHDIVQGLWGHPHLLSAEQHGYVTFYGNLFNLWSFKRKGSCPLLKVLGPPSRLWWRQSQFTAKTKTEPLTLCFYNSSGCQLTRGWLVYLPLLLCSIHSNNLSLSSLSLNQNPLISTYAL